MKNIENLRQLKETAELRILEVIKTLEYLQNAYGIIKVGDALDSLREVRTTLLLDLDQLNKP